MLMRVLNLLKKPWKNVTVELFNVSTKNRKPKTKKTDLNGLVYFPINSSNRYLARVHAGNIVFEKMIEEDKSIINMKLNTFFGILKKERLLSNNKFCSYCKFQYDDIVEKFKCHYCGNKHCSNHRLPENHVCPGLPKKPQSRFREVHVGKKMYVESDY
jgi:hypothetical protein